MAKRELFNTRTQTVEQAEFTVDPNNEIVATFEDGGIVKFPAGLSKEQFEEAIVAHQTVNQGQEIITPEVEAAVAAERANSLALIGETEETLTANTMAESQYNDDTNNDPAAGQPATPEQPAADPGTAPVAV